MVSSPDTITQRDHFFNLSVVVKLAPRPAEIGNAAALFEAVENLDGTALATVIDDVGGDSTAPADIEAFSAAQRNITTG